jgi:hypothetical protein
MNVRALLALAVPAMLVVSACSSTVTTPAPGTAASVSPGPVPGPPSGDRYVDLARMLHDRGIEIWFEADLVKRWLEGPAALAKAVERLGELAHQVPVAGFKIADELGYNDGITSVSQATSFLRDSRAALNRVAPKADVLIDILVPQLGCPDGDAAGSCRAEAAHAYPAATITGLTSYLGAGLLDRIDLSTGLRDGTPAAMESDQRRAWAEVRTLGWRDQTRLQARKALAAPGGYPGDAAQAQDVARTYIDIPKQNGAGAVDIWTWRQSYQGQLVGILGTELTPNALWRELVRRKQSGTVLFTHMTPSLLTTDPVKLGHECDLVGQAFGAVFVAAGTG